MGVDGRNIVVTGIPRSGTTLVCYLLHQLPNTVALVEPWLGWRFFLTRNPERACEAVVRFFERTRSRILDARPVLSLHRHGEIPTNTVEEQRRAATLRRLQVRIGWFRIRKPVTSDFWLVVKYPGVFTALLEGLVRRFPVYALIRNPLAVLASWDSVNLSVRKGRLPTTERLDASLRRMLSKLPDRFERQIRLLGWFFEKYRRVLPPSAIFRYEDIVRSGGRALAAIVPEAAQLNVPLQERNRSPLYDPDLMCALGERLLRTDGPYWDFYTRESVEQLLDEIRQR